MLDHLGDQEEADIASPDGVTQPLPRLIPVLQVRFPVLRESRDQRRFHQKDKLEQVGKRTATPLPTATARQRAHADTAYWA